MGKGKGGACLGRGRRGNWCWYEKYKVNFIIKNEKNGNLIFKEKEKQFQRKKPKNPYYNLKSNLITFKLTNAMVAIYP